MSKKCCICKSVFTPRFSTTERCCQNYDCKVEYALQVVSKQREAKEKKRKQEYTKEKLELKESLKTLSDWNKDLQTEINKIVRAIDAGYPCIATGSYEGQMHAGHYVSLGSNPTLRFHLENIWIQSMHSNTWKSGDTIRYQEGIVSLYGKDYLEYMNSLQSITPVKLTIHEIKEKIPIARSIIKWLKLQNRKFTLEERISLRRRFNNELGIYN